MLISRREREGKGEGEGGRRAKREWVDHLIIIDSQGYGGRKGGRDGRGDG